VADLHTLLTARGNTVGLIEGSSAGLSPAIAAGALARGGWHPDQVARAVRELGAEVVHAHNLHPLFGWRALAAAHRAGARTVVHLHNFRLFCAIGIAYRDAAPCFRCRGTDTLPGLRLRCRGSLSEAAAYAFGLHRQQPHLFEHADRFVAVSQATADRLSGLGLPGQGTSVLTNFVPAAGFAAASHAGDGEFALVSGRLTQEKGVDTAIAAARTAGVPLVIAGDGPDENRLRALAQGGDVRFVGWLSPAALAELRSRAGVVLIPSRWEEPCPYGALDALAAGVPVLASDVGGLPELVGADALLPAGDVPRWTDALAALWNDSSARQRRGAEVLLDARDRLNEDVYYERLMTVYRGL
jgi:glycosyltransferase involved in cell wall biosynthesis